MTTSPTLGRIKSKQDYGTAIAQIKGGNYFPSDIRDFRTAMKDAKADMGVFLVTKPPSPKMQAAAAKAKTYESVVQKCLSDAYILEFPSQHSAQSASSVIIRYSDS